ncbi:MAG: hypothetical protein CL920_35275 [Deltaproteobacteria bacterium]|nr:hypothetical protein [Deltaproteobacteria bacterium]MBU53986.1 hypothetical protein [Deltaproteobacteria bacterium]|tara:strand:- start:3775 stop:4656 length:882 start_codon:yes stop_codon:yes gene_type:complete
MFRCFIIIAMMGALYACTAPPQATCVAGRVESCPCRDGRTGVQICTASNTWTQCECERGGSSKESTTKDAGQQDIPDQSVVEAHADISVVEHTPEKGTSQLCFKRDVLPIFVSNCAMSGCHDSITKEDDIDLSSYASIMASDDGEGIVPGRPDKSEVFESITEDDLEDRMPPPPRSTLSAKQIATLRQWILEGAKNTTCESGGETCKTEEMRYAAHISPVIGRSCLGCHNKTSPLGGVSLASYDDVVKYAKSGLLMKVIRHEAGVKAMPPSGGKLPDCEIKQFQAWITQGMKP